LRNCLGHHQPEHDCRQTPHDIDNQHENNDQSQAVVVLLVTLLLLEDKAKIDVPTKPLPWKN